MKILKLFFKSGYAFANAAAVYLKFLFTSNARSNSTAEP
jgi:hypothetical protein